MSFQTLLGWLIALGTIVCTAQTTPEQSPDLKVALERIGPVFAPLNLNKYHNLTPEERLLLIEHFREQKRLADDPASRDGMREHKAMEANRALPLLGDPETIDAALRTFIELPLTQRHEQLQAFVTLGLVSDPKAVERLAPEMLKDEPYEMVQLSDADNYEPKSYTASRLMLKIVANSPAFDGKTRKWAEDNWLLSGEERQPVARQWWKENEQFFKSADYKAVKPGEELMGKLDEEVRKHQEWAAARDAKEAAERAAREASAAATRAVATTSSGGGWGAFGYGLIGLLVLGLVAALMFYGRSARHV